MKSTVVDESLSSYKPMYCSREYQTSTRLNQQYEKSTLNINHNPALYATAWAATTARTSHQYEEQNDVKNGQKETDINTHHKDEENMQEKGTVHISARSDPAQVNKVIKTRSGCVIKKPDRLTYI